MSRSTFSIIASAVSFIGGGASLLAPQQVGAFYGIAFDQAALGQAQLLGAAYLGYALLNWFAREVHDAAAQRALAIGNCAAWAVSLAVVSIALATTSLSVGATVWSLVAMQAFFAAAWAYYAVGRSREVRAAI